jgi:hypothetical protein
MMRISVAGILLGLLLALGVSPSGVAQESEHVTLPGAVWAIIPPPGFVVVAEPFALFRHASGTYIMLQDRPKGPVTKSDFNASPDIRLDELTEVTVDGKHGFLAVAHYQSRQATFILLSVEGEATNGRISAMIPDSAADKVSLDEIRKAVLSAVERPKAIDERLTDLSFGPSAMSGMRIVHYVPGVVLILTDGPLDDPEVMSEQNYAIIDTHDTGGVAFDPTGNLGAMVRRLKESYPDARMLSSQILKRPEGNIAEIRYERTTKLSGLIVGGVTWAKPLGSRAVIMVCQHPRGDEAAFVRLLRILDGLREK